MSRRSLKWTLWLAFTLLVPVPFIMIVTGFAPPVRVWFLTWVLGAIAIADGAQGPMAILLGVLVVEGLFFAGLAYFAAGLALSGFARWLPARFVAPLGAVTVTSLLCMSFFEIYHLPHSSKAMYTNVTGLFD